MTFHSANLAKFPIDKIKSYFFMRKLHEYVQLQMPFYVDVLFFVFFKNGVLKITILWKSQLVNHLLFPNSIWVPEFELR